MLWHIPSFLRMLCFSFLFTFSIFISAEDAIFEYRSLSGHYNEYIRANTFTDEPCMQTTSPFAPNTQPTQYIPTWSSSSNCRPQTRAVDNSEGDIPSGGWNEMGYSDDVEYLSLLIMFYIFCKKVNNCIKSSRKNLID